MGPSTSSALGLVRPLLGARPRVLPMPPQRVATPAAPACARGLTIVSSTAVTPRKKEHKPRTSRRQKKNDGFRVPHVGPVISGRQLVPPRFLGGVNGRLAANIWTRSAIDKLDGLMPSNESLRVLLDDLFTSDRGKALYDQLHSTLETTKLNASQDDLDALDAYADELKLTEPVRDTLKDMVRVGVFNKPALKEVARLYDSLILEALRYQQVEVTSHKPLTEEEKLKVKVGLQTANLSILPKFGKVKIDYKVDPAIEGGYIIDFPREKQRFDLSLKSRHEMVEWIARRGF